MKLIEVSELLRKEFPGRYVSVTWNATTHKSGYIECEMSIYDDEHGHILCSSVEGGIAALKEKIWQSSKWMKESAKNVEAPLMNEQEETR